MTTIGVLCMEGEEPFAREFFELFKTPWEFAQAGREYAALVSTRDDAAAANAALCILYAARETACDVIHGVEVAPAAPGRVIDCGALQLPIYGTLVTFQGQEQAHVYRVAGNCGVAGGEAGTGQRPVTLRVGYDLFQEIAFLLQQGQPADHALWPALELHIALLREWIVGAGLTLVEIPPAPWGSRFFACLTHDVDFAGIRRHRLDHTVWGFLYRAIFTSLRKWIRRECTLGSMWRNWMAVASLPLIYLGLLDDFWEHFDAYAEIDPALSTFFLIPFKQRAGECVSSPHASRRATRYDVDDVRDHVRDLAQRGFEIGLHGIDAWHSVECARQERARIVGVSGQSETGVRMHWLCFDAESPARLEQAGLNYDATSGYNETIGYKAGTMQVFKPLSASRLLELPLHIQDTALFYPRRMGLTETQAWAQCGSLLDSAARFGGVLTVSWHERSLAPERLWGGFYRRLLCELEARGARFISAGKAVHWFRARRALQFAECSITPDHVRLRLTRQDAHLDPPLLLRVHLPSPAGTRCVERACTGEPWVEIERV
jgi:hypothetical protein